MIKYNDNTINDWDFGTSNLIKVYRNNAVCYYKITSSGGTSAQTPCYAVVDDITQYTDREFEDVFDNATEKWYKLNNLNQYEEYGVYASGRTDCSANFTELTDIIAQSTTALTNHNVTVTPAVGSFSKIRIDTTKSATSTSYDWATFTKTPNGTEVLAISTGTIGAMGGYGNNKNYVTDANGSQTFAHWVDTNHTIVEIDIAALSNNQASELYLLFYQENCNTAAFSFYMQAANCVTTYEGKLTIDNGYEYIYSGGSWVNVGEVSGSTITIKSPEYIEKTSLHGGRINLDYVWKTNTKMQFKFYSTNNGGGCMIGEDGTPDTNDCRVFFASTTAYFDYGSGRISWSSYGQKNTLYEYEYGNYYIKNMVTSSIKTGTTFSTNRTNSLYLGLGDSDRFRTYYIKIYDGDTLVKDFIPWTDMNGNYGLYDKVSLSVYNVVSGYGSLTGSSNVTDVEIGGGYEYPLEYVVREDPPNNVSFSSMTEAEEYECPWVGMQATIDGDRYVFSGDSISGYEWVYNQSRLPQGYTEVEYIQNSGTSYFNTNFVPNQDTRVVCDMQNVTASNYPRLWGAGQWNSATGLMIDYDSNKFQVSWFGNTSWTDYTSYPTSTSYYRHTYDLNKNYMYIDETLVGSNTYTTKTASDPIGIFVHIYNGRPSSSSYWGQEHFKGKMYSFQIYDNGTLVRDLVPCIRDNDNEVGAYDIVNDVFYTVPSGYTTDKLIAGPTV